MNETKSEITIQQEVREALARHLKIPISEIRIDSELSKGLGVDSFGMFELTHELQEKFKVQIPDEQLMKLVRVEDVVRCIESNMKGNEK